MLSAPAFELRPELLAVAPRLASPFDDLREAADRIEREVSPHPLAGIRAWLHGEERSGAVEFSAAELTTGQRVDELLATAATLWGGSAHANAALAWKTYCYWNLAPAMLGYIVARRVPVMDAGNAVFAVSEDAPMFSVRQLRPRFLALPHDPCADRPEVKVVANEEELLERMHAQLFAGHLEPVLEAFLARVRVGRRTLMGSVASGLAYATASMAQVVADPPEVLAKTLLQAFDVGHLVDVWTDRSGRLEYRRRTCCLALTLEGARTCATCCVQTEQR